jgi:hypothetical protein
MTLLRRNNYKWNVNELLALQREYELLGMSIQDISAKHGRSIESILYRLQQEDFIETWIDATGYQEYSKTQSCFPKSFVYNSKNEYDDDDNDNDSDYEESELDNDKDDSDYEESESEYESVDDDYDEESESESESDYDLVDCDNDNDSDYENENTNDKNEISSLDKRVWSLENTVNDIKKMIMSIVYKLNIPYSETVC